MKGNRITLKPEQEYFITGFFQAHFKEKDEYFFGDFALYRHADWPLHEYEETPYIPRVIIALQATGEPIGFDRALQAMKLGYMVSRRSREDMRLELINGKGICIVDDKHGTIKPFIGAMDDELLADDWYIM